MISSREIILFFSLYSSYRWIISQINNVYSVMCSEKRNSMVYSISNASTQKTRNFNNFGRGCVISTRKCGGRDVII